MTGCNTVNSNLRLPPFITSSSSVPIHTDSAYRCTLMSCRNLLLGNNELRCSYLPIMSIFGLPCFFIPNPLKQLVHLSEDPVINPSTATDLIKSATLNDGRAASLLEHATRICVPLSQSVTLSHVGALPSVRINIDECRVINSKPYPMNMPRRGILLCRAANFLGCNRRKATSEEYINGASCTEVCKIDPATS
jgi:hypothetical protein